MTAVSGGNTMAAGSEDQSALVNGRGNGRAPIVASGDAYDAELASSNALRSHGRTRRGPRPLSPAWNKLRRGGLTMLVLPATAAVMLREAVADLSQRIEERRPGNAEPVFERPKEMPLGDKRSVDDIVDRLQMFPYRPRPMSTHRAFYDAFGSEGLGMLTANKPALQAFPHMYPRQFRKCLLEGADHVQLSGLKAMHDTPGPALVICHGLLTSKNFDYVRSVALRAFFQWGFHVITLDLRGWGESAWTTEAPSSAGYEEGRDLVQIARDLHKDPLVTSVGVMGFSLGGSTVLNAARHATRDGDSPIDGGVMSLNAPTDITRATRYIGTKPKSVRHPYFGLYMLFRTSMKAGMRRQGYDTRQFGDWKELTSKIAAPYYGVSPEEFDRRASAVTFADEIEIPTLHMHATDDFVVPVDHAFMLDEARKGNPNVRVWVVPQGNHCAFSSVDPRWYHSVVRRWFEYWAREA
jgi:uncharacterized protein